MSAASPVSTGPEPAEFEDPTSPPLSLDWLGVQSEPLDPLGPEAAEWRSSVDPVLRAEVSLELLS